MFYQASPPARTSTAPRLPLFTGLAALRRNAGRPFAILIIALLAGVPVLYSTPRHYVGPYGQAPVRYSVGADGIPWDCARVQREQYVASWTITRVGLPYLIIISCSPA